MSMTRVLRLEGEGAVYHVIVRGNERKAVFRDDKDRRAYLDRLAKCRERFGFRLLRVVVSRYRRFMGEKEAESYEDRDAQRDQRRREDVLAPVENEGGARSPTAREESPCGDRVDAENPEQRDGSTQRAASSVRTGGRPETRSR
jgi:hypothetical protein